MFEIITLTTTEYGKVRCYKIGELAVFKTNNVHKVYIIRNRKPFLDTSFADEESAVKFAEWIDKVFAEYFVLLDEYPNMDLSSVCKWSVNDGVRIYATIQHLKTERKMITLQTIAQAFKNSTNTVKEWLRQ